MEKLKAIIICLLLAVSASAIKAQHPIFDKFSDKDKVTSVYISKTMLQMQPDLYTKDVYIGKVAGQLEAVFIVSTTDNTMRHTMRTDIDNFIKKSKFEVLMKQKGTSASSSFYVRKKGDKVKELVMITDGRDKLSFIHLIGDMTLKDIQGITSRQTLSHHFMLPIPDCEEILQRVHRMDLAWLENNVRNLCIPQSGSITVGGVNIKF